MGNIRKMYKNITIRSQNITSRNSNPYTDGQYTRTDNMKLYKLSTKIKENGIIQITEEQQKENDYFCNIHFAKKRMKMCYIFLPFIRFNQNTITKNDIE